MLETKLLYGMTVCADEYGTKGGVVSLTHTFYGMSIAHCLFVIVLLGIHICFRMRMCACVCLVLFCFPISYTHLKSLFFVLFFCVLFRIIYIVYDYCYSLIVFNHSSPHFCNSFFWCAANQNGGISKITTNWVDYILLHASISSGTFIFQITFIYLIQTPSIQTAKKRCNRDRANEILLIQFWINRQNVRTHLRAALYGSIG